MSTKRKQSLDSFEPVVVDRRLYVVLHHLNARLTSVEQALARLQNTAVPPKRTRSKPKSVAAIPLDCPSQPPRCFSSQLRTTVLTDSSIFNPKNLSTFDPSRSQRAPFVPSHGRLGVPTNHPAIPAHRDAVRAPIMPVPDSAPPRRDIGPNQRSR
jgi:hypothetical protein